MNGAGLEKLDSIARRNPSPDPKLHLQAARDLAVNAENADKLVALRDETPGFGVSLIKAGLRRSGLPVGSVRAPLMDPTPAQEDRLAAILGDGRALL